jgi:dienelactone hydrolase
MKRFFAAAVLCLCIGAITAARAADPPGQSSQLVVRKVKIGEIPALVVSPPDTKGRSLILWYPGFSGTKEGTEGQLRQLAARGYVAMSPEVYQHGERRIEPQAQLPLRVRSNIRRYFWPILAKTAEETTPAIDWAIKELGVRPEVGIGGTSMGGDLSVAAAGVDKRIKVVSAIVATPDWMRPGSWEPPGEPDTAAQAWYDKRNPLTHLDAYRHRPWIAFQSGAVDIQVPPDGGERFIAVLKKGIYKGYEDHLEVNLIPGMGHGFHPKMMENSIAWFEAHLPK